MPDETLVASASAVVSAVVDAFVRTESRLVRVVAPPGAGKSRLVRAVMAAAMEEGATALVAVQTNAQAIDLATAMANELAAAGRRDTFGVWPSSQAREDYAAEVDWLRAHPNVTLCENTSALDNGPDVVLAVARKWAFHNAAYQDNLRFSRRFELGVVDEAYQMRAGELMRFGDRVERLLMVGDPGQLEPFTPVDDERWSGLEASPLTPSPHAVEALLGAGAVTSFALPASFRLDARAAPLVAACFYPSLSFRAVSQPGDRELRLSPATDTAPPCVDAALETAAATGWARLDLPEAPTVRDDPVVATTLVTLAQRLLARNAIVRAEWPADLRKGARLDPSNLAIAVAHRDQRARVRELLDRIPPLRLATVDTANRLQGREYDVVLVWHPLSGRTDASAFHLDTGRLCVMTSRHRQACILVSRAGLPEMLDDHIPSGQRPRGARDDREHDGWRAHRRLLDAVPVVAGRAA